jgi:hypothetical protein
MTKKGILYILATLASVLIFTQTASAQGAVYGQQCKIEILPYNLSALFETTWPQSLNFANNIYGTACERFLRYPQSSSTGVQYSPQPPRDADTPLKAGSEDRRISWTTHDHAYFNDSVHTSAGGLYYYKSFTDKFEITLQPDANSNLDLGSQLQNLACWTTTPSGYGGDISNILDCDGYVSDLFGGTRVTKVRSGNKIIVTWDFAENPDHRGRPVIFGNNGSAWRPYSGGIAQDPLNLTDPNNRKLEFRVNFKTDNNDDVWSATTTSRALIADSAMRKINYPDNFGTGCVNNDINNANSGWCYQPARSGYPTESVTSSSGTYTNTYYWYPIGSTATIWKKPVEEQPPVCEEVTLDPPYVLAPGTTNYTARVRFSDGNSYQTTLNWGGNGTFSQGVNQTESDNTFNNSFTTDRTSSAVIARVTNIVGAENSDACREGVTVTQGGPYCTDLILTPAYLNDYPASTPLQASAVFSDGKAYTTTVNWSGDGSFSAGNSQTSANARFNNTFTPSSDTATAAVRVTNVIGARNSDVCQEPRLITPRTTEYLCEDLNLNTWRETVEPGETIYLTADPRNTDGSLVPMVRWAESGNGYFTPGPNSARNPALCYVSPIANSADISFTRSRYCDYYYTAPQTENGYVTIEAVPNIGNVPDCRDRIEVQEEGYDDICLDLDLIPQYLSTDSASTDLTAILEFASGNPYTVDLEWDGRYGEFMNGDSHMIQRGNSRGIDNRFTRDIDRYGAYAQVRLEEVITDLNVDLGDCADYVRIETPPLICEWLDLYMDGYDVCFDVDPNFNGDRVLWTIGNRSFRAPTEDNCQEAPPNTFVHVWATEICQDEITTEDRPPDLNKLVRRLFPSVGPFRTITTTPATMPEDEPILVEYRVEFIPYSLTTATIVDPIAYGIEGESYPSYYPEGTLVYANEMRVMENDSRSLSQCQEDGDTNCYSGSIGSTSGITLYGVDSPIVIYYKGEVKDTSITPENCTDPDNPSCYEFYRNRARITQYETEYSRGSNIYSNWAEVQLFCQYILTRAAGDIFLERALDYGIDISWCAEVPNVPGVPVTPGTPPPPGTPSTGITEQIRTISHEICAQGQAGTLDPNLGAFYGKDIIGNISSEICEIKLQTAGDWRQSVITNSIDENKTRISRWGADFTGNQFIGAITNKLETQDVVHIKGDLTVNFPLTWADGQGARTIIIENGDLIINEDIKYGPCVGTCSVNEIASLAFIVLNGNIYVDPDVNELAGVYFVQEGSTPRTGNLYSGSPSNNAVKSYIPLKIFGSVYGDIEPLFRDRVFAGDPTLEEAGIVIRFDERVILNTPPGLTDILDLSLFEVAR